MAKELWLGVIGGIFGILGGIVALVVGGLGEALGMGDAGLYVLGTFAILFSGVGMLTPVLIDNKEWVAVLMIVSGVIVLIMISAFGVLTFALFLIGGIIAYRKKTSPKGRGSSKESNKSGGL